MSSSTSLSLSFDPFPLPQQQPLPTTTTTTTTTTTMSGDSDTGTSTPPRQPPTGFLPFANGSLKRHYPTSSSEPQPDSSSSLVTYKECMRNHAASIGGHALDGCCEFMPSPTSTPSVPTSLRCAACGCHRNFHRRDPDDPLPIQHHPISSSAPPLPLIPHLPPPPRKHGDHNSSSAPHMLLALSREHAGTGTGTMMKKRSRTKFTREQKERMREFSEKIGWRMLRTHDHSITEFCDQIGVGRGVLKVWMHNHKRNAALGNKDGSNETSMDKSDIGSKDDDDLGVRDCKVEGNNADRRGEFYTNGHLISEFDIIGRFR